MKKLAKQNLIDAKKKEGVLSEKLVTLGEDDMDGTGASAKRMVQAEIDEIAEKGNRRSHRTCKLEMN